MNELFSRLWSWLKYPDERKMFIAGGEHKFRLPWSRMMSVKDATDDATFEAMARQDVVGRRYLRAAFIKR